MSVKLHTTRSNRFDRPLHEPASQNKLARSSEIVAEVGFTPGKDARLMPVPADQSYDHTIGRRRHRVCALPLLLCILLVRWD